MPNVNVNALAIAASTDYPFRSSTSDVVFPAGSYRFAQNTTLAQNIRFVRGAKLKPDSGVTVTLTGQIDAGPYQIFDETAGGTVTIDSSNGTLVEFPEWRGSAGAAIGRRPLSMAADARFVADKNGSGATVLYTSGFADRTPHAFQSYRGVSATPNTEIGAQVKLIMCRSLKTVKTGTMTATSGSAALNVPSWPIGSVRGFVAGDVGRAISHTVGAFPPGTTILSVTDINNATASANATASGSGTLTVGSVTTDTVNQFEIEGNSSLHIGVKDAVGNQAQLNGAFFQVDINEATSWDGLGAGSIVRMGPSSDRVGQGFYGHVEKQNPAAKIFGAEMRAHNNSGVDDTYNPIAASGTHGLWITAGGTANCAAAVSVGSVGRTWAVGYAAVAGSVTGQFVRDDSSSTTSIDINGSHTDAVDTYGATLSGAALRMARAHYLTWRNAADSADLGNVIGVDSSNRLTLGVGSIANVLVARSVVLNAGVNLTTDTVTGSKIGSATTQKWGFWNATPVVQPTAVADAAGGATVDAEARTALNAFLARMRTIGLIAT